MSPDAIRAAIRRLAFGESLSGEELAAAFTLVMRGEATPAQVGALLMALRVKGETPSEVAAVARALRGAMVHLGATQPESLVDTCGTGGGAVPTFNISTAAALVAAGAGVRIAKHGNRSFTSRCGSADVLEALGVAIDVPVARMEQALVDAGIVFMFAPVMHPAMRHIGPVRRELAIPTVMNIVGPLANPASAGRQVLGVAEPSRLPLLAGALAELGTVHAMVVHGEPGLDEISPMGVTHVTEIRDGHTTHWEIEPTALGLAVASAEELAGSEPAVNARVILEVLRNGGPAGARTAVQLNAAAAIYVGGRTRTFKDAVDVAGRAIREGQGMAALERLRAVQGVIAPPPTA